MELITRDWKGVRFGLPAPWRAFLFDNGAVAAGPSGETFALTRRPGHVETLAGTWRARFAALGGRVVSEARPRGAISGLLRVTIVDAGEARVVTQLFVGGPDTVTATYAAPAVTSYDPSRADDIIRSILVRRSTPA